MGSSAPRKHHNSHLKASSPAKKSWKTNTHGTPTSTHREPLPQQNTLATRRRLSPNTSSLHFLYTPIPPPLNTSAAHQSVQVHTRTERARDENLTALCAVTHNNQLFQPCSAVSSFVKTKTVSPALSSSRALKCKANTSWKAPIAGVMPRTGLFKRSDTKP